MNNAEIAALLRSQISQLVWTPESKAVFTDWLEEVPNDYPTSIAAVVGFNYALEAMAQHFDQLAADDDAA